MTIKQCICLKLIFALVLASCNKVIPAGFWKGYKKEFLIKNISDQGPYGGHRAMYWKTANREVFSSKHIIEFASKNGWEFVDSSVYSSEQINKWITYNNKPIFPLTSLGFSDTIIQSSQFNHFPRWITGSLKLYKFKTGFVTIEPGTDEHIEDNGFVLVNAEGAEMALYHLWGE